MNKHLFTLLMFLTLTAIGSYGQYWDIKTNDTIYYQSPVIIGNNIGENSMLSLVSSFNGYNGGGYGLISKHSTNTSYLSFHSRTRLGYSSNWYEQSQGASIAGALYLSKDNASSVSSRSAGGLFILEFDDYMPYDYSSNTHYLGGTYNAIRGTIYEYPTNSIISGIIAEDKIGSDNTYAGYFLGKSYFSENVGIATDSPSAKLEIADGDIYISDINKGIIMKSPDGNCWRGVLDNSGSLTFTKITCPEESIVSTAVGEKELKSSSYNVQVYPNPVDDQITLSVDGYDDEELMYSIINISGSVVLSNTVKNSNDIDVSSLNSGAYIIKVSDINNNTIGNTKFIVN